MMSTLKEYFAGGKRWLFFAELHGACTLYQWIARSSLWLVGDFVDLTQWPELRLAPGRVELECNGPDDLQLAARVRLTDGKFSMIVFRREPEPLK